MITSRLPFWRTNPVGFAASGYWPILTGCLAVLIVPSLLAFPVELVGDILFALHTPQNDAVELLAIMLYGSPLLSWPALVGAVPISLTCAAKGRAGWGVAALCGGVAGSLAEMIVGGAVSESYSPSLAIAGMIIALVYWLALRLFYPATLGIISKGTTFGPAP